MLSTDWNWLPCLQKTVLIDGSSQGSWPPKTCRDQLREMGLYASLGWGVLLSHNPAISQLSSGPVGVMFWGGGGGGGGDVYLCLIDNEF